MMTIATPALPPYSRPRQSVARGGFSLLEMSIVIGVIGVMLGGIWAVAGTMREKQKISQSAQEVSQVVTLVRSTFLGQAGLGTTPTTNDDFPSLMQRLNNYHALPTELLHATTTTCGSMTTNFADSPLVGTNTACGSLRICGWAIGVTNGCNTGNGVTGLAQYFGVDFEGLDTGGCLGLIAKVSPAQPPALVDVYINGVGSVNSGQSLPVPRAWAITQCSATTNAVQFVYRLRPPM